jgi:hypothetical protein
LFELLYWKTSVDADPRRCDFLEEMRRYNCAGRIFLSMGLELRIVKSPLKLHCRFPNVIVDEYTATGNPAVKLRRYESRLLLHDLSHGGPYL